MMTFSAENFDPDFAGPGEWAAMYRAYGLQVIPCYHPGEPEAGASWKRPRLSKWTTLQESLVPDASFERWYGKGGEYASRQNMGILTGRASKNAFVIDLDDHKGPTAGDWWRGILAKHNHSIEPETWRQNTGGGGRQILFQARADWHAPTNRTPIGVDIRGQGGFAVMPSSLHENGKRYTWAPGCAPFEIPIAEAPEWLLNEIYILVEQYGGDTYAPHQKTERTASGADFDSFGNRTDGREDAMTRLIWRDIVGWYRECPIQPTEPESRARMRAAWTVYERSNRTRIHGADNEEGLEREGRGPTLFDQKWRRAFSKWHTDIAEAARRSFDKDDKQSEKDEFASSSQQDQKIKTVDFMTLYSEDVVEEPDYIEPGFAGPGNFVLIAGPPKAQKSFLLQEMLVAAATGGSFLINTFQCPKPLRIFYLQAEMNRKLLRKRARELQLLSLEEKRLLAENLIISERFHMILNEDGVKTAVATIKDRFPDEPPDIIAVDPLANVFDQENENDNAQLMRFLTGRIESVRQQINPSACVVMVHHATKKSSEEMAKDPFVAIRGAGALRGYYDSAIVIFRASEESKTRKIHFELRSGESPEPLSLELVGGRFKSVSETSSITKDTARLILREMNAAWLRNAPWSPHERSKVEGRYAVFNASKQFNANPKAVKALLDEWLFNSIVTFRDRVQGKRPAGLQVTGSID